MPPRARRQWSVLLLLPLIAVAGWAYWKHTDVPAGGVVDSIRLTTKPGLVGQAAEAKRLVMPTRPDLYLKVVLANKPDLRLETRNNCVIGNGVSWGLAQPIDQQIVREINVWDEDVFKDAQLDHVQMNGWASEGEQFRLELIGRPNTPPDWALPMACVAGALAAVVLLRFVRTQVV